MKKYVFICAIVLMVGALILGACAGPGAPGKAIDAKLANANPDPAVFVWGVTAPWAEEITAATNGAITFTQYNAGSLGPYNEHWNMVAQGLADVSFHFASYSPGAFDLAQVVELPNTGILTAVTENQVLFDLIQNNKYFQKEFEAAKVLYCASTPKRVLHTTKPVRTLEDLKGMRIATLGKWDSRAIELLGGTPTHVLVPEQYMALERGIVDGTLLLNEGILAFKMNEHIKFSVYSDFPMICGFTSMNHDFFNALPRNLQKTVVEVSDTWSVKAGENLDKAEAEMGGVLESMGIEQYVLPPDERARWDKAVEPLLAEWIAVADSEGAPGQEILDEVKMLAEKYSQ